VSGPHQGLGVRQAAVAAKPTGIANAPGDSSLGICGCKYEWLRPAAIHSSRRIPPLSSVGVRAQPPTAQRLAHRLRYIASVLLAVGLAALGASIVIPSGLDATAVRPGKRR